MNLEKYIPASVAQSPQAVMIADLKLGLQLDRTGVKRLLKTVAKFTADGPVGCSIMAAQLQACLERRDWLVVLVSAPSVESLRQFGVSIGVIEEKREQLPKGRTPMQRWQAGRGPRGHSS